MTYPFSFCHVRLDGIQVIPKSLNSQQESLGSPNHFGAHSKVIIQEKTISSQPLFPHKDAKKVRCSGRGDHKGHE